MTGDNPVEKPWEDEIERYYAHQSTQLTETDYCRIDPGTYTYILDPTKRSLNYLAERLDGNTLARKGVSSVLRGFSSVPGLVNVLPKFNRCQVRVDSDHKFNFAILGSRTKLLDWDSGTAITLSNGFPEFVRKEIDIRRKLPDGVRVPEIIDADSRFPFLIERFIDDADLVDPVDDWEQFRESYLQLRVAYEYFPSESIPTDRVLTEVESSLRRRGLLHDTMIEQAFQTVKQMELPESLARGFVHGDMYKGNVLKTDDRILIIDWAESGFDRYQFGDFAHSFIKRYRFTNDSSVLREIFRNIGIGAKILSNYSDNLGETVWNSSSPFPGSVLLYPLIILAEGRYERDFTDTIFYSSIRALLDC